MALIPIPNKESKNPQDASLIQHDKDYKYTLINYLEKNLVDHPAKLLKEELEQINQLLSYDTQNINIINQHLEKIKELIENCDNANIFVDIGGFQIFLKLFQYQNDDILKESCDLLAELCQNHKKSQDESIKYNLLPIVINILINDKNQETKIKSFYALSSMLRGNEMLQNQYLSLNGIDILIQCLECDIEKLRIKATLLAMYMSLENHEIRSQLVNKGLLKKLVDSAIQQEHNLNHEHIMNAILTLLKSDPNLVKDLKNMYPNFKEFLLERANMLMGKPEYIEEENYVKVLYQMCYESDLDGALNSMLSLHS